jgi:hypothetical protein
VLFILTFITSISAVLLFRPVLDDPAGYIAGDGKDNQIYLGAFLEFLLVITNVGTAVALYPIARRQNARLTEVGLLIREQQRGRTVYQLGPNAQRMIEAAARKRTLPFARIEDQEAAQLA